MYISSLGRVMPDDNTITSIANSHFKVSLGNVHTQLFISGFESEGPVFH